MGESDKETISYGMRKEAVAKFDSLPEDVRQDIIAEVYWNTDLMDDCEFPEEG